MPSLLAVVHQSHSTTGLVGALLEQRGYAMDTRCIAAGDRLPTTLDHHDAVIVFGGPMSANDDDTVPCIHQELHWIPDVLAANKPFLGICLGAQLLARVLGATVAPHRDRKVEIGYFPIDLTEEGQDRFQGLTHVYHWHREGFEIPCTATLLAQGVTFPNQAFQWGQHTYGLQFHPEITASMIQKWTTKAADHLTLPGAQPLNSHFYDHQQHASSVESWLNRFLDQWLSPFEVKG
ncbi:MAG: glutamine amidotransferase [Cyanobacteria bacterium J06626_14]